MRKKHKTDYGLNIKDLSITALYTSGVWNWYGFANAHLFITDQAKVVFRITNLALRIARLFNRNLDILSYSLIQRHQIIDTVLKNSKLRRVIEIGAGLSPRGVTFSADPSVEYTEVDLEHVVQLKRQLLMRSNEGATILSRPNLSFTAKDVLTDKLDLTDPGEGLFIIAEGLIMYLDPNQRKEIFAKVFSLLKKAPKGIFIFDFVPPSEKPKTGIIGKFLAGLMKYFTGGHSFVWDSVARDQISRELLELGFDQTVLLEPLSFAKRYSLPFSTKKTQQLLFVAGLGEVSLDMISDGGP